MFDLLSIHKNSSKKPFGAVSPFSQHNTSHDNVREDRHQAGNEYWTGGSIANINADGTFTHAEQDESQKSHFGASCHILEATFLEPPFTLPPFVPPLRLAHTWTRTDRLISTTSPDTNLRVTDRRPSTPSFHGAIKHDQFFY